MTKSSPSVQEQVRAYIETLLPPDMRAKWPTLWNAMVEIAAEQDRLLSKIDRLTALVAAAETQLKRMLYVFDTGTDGLLGAEYETCRDARAFLSRLSGDAKRWVRFASR